MVKRLLVVLVITTLSIPIVPAAAADDGYLPFPNGDRIKVQQGTCDHGGEYSHCDEWNYYAWDLQYCRRKRNCSARSEGKLVISATSGTVVSTRDSIAEVITQKYDSRASGNYVIVENDDGTFTQYIHLQLGSVVVEPGDTVQVGSPLGRIGHTGYTGGVAHLHMQWMSFWNEWGNGHSTPASFIGIGDPWTGTFVRSNNPGTGTGASVL